MQVSRKADRERMAAAITAIADRHGFTADVHVFPERTLVVEVDTGHLLQCSIHLAKVPGLNPNTFCADWYMGRTEPGVEKPKLHVSFARFSVNPSHFGKATTVVDGWDAFLLELDYQFGRVTDGSAFQ